MVDQDPTPKDINFSSPLSKPTLTDRERFVQRESLLHGRTQSDIGQELGIHRTTVGRIRRRAWNKLIDRLVGVTRNLVNEYKDKPFPPGV